MAVGVRVIWSVGVAVSVTVRAAVPVRVVLWVIASVSVIVRGWARVHWGWLACPSLVNCLGKPPAWPVVNRLPL
jgi:hypothetical protein